GKERVHWSGDREAVGLMNADSSSRAGSPLLFGLAPRGVFRASGVTTGAVGSYPTFSPLPNVACIAKTSRRFPCAMPPCCAPPAARSAVASRRDRQSTRLISSHVAISHVGTGL